MILDEVSGVWPQAGGGRGASFLVRKNKVGPVPKECWKGANDDKIKLGGGKR